MASARRAAGYGAKVGLIESSRLGGTCVNVGCVPKKVMYNAATVSEVLHDAAHFGFEVTKSEFNWQQLKKERDAYVARLNGVYDRLLTNSKVQVLHGKGCFVKAREVAVGGNSYTADNVLIAVGGRPSLPSSSVLKGVEHCISSDDFFALEQQPRSVAVVGAGYIGVELAGIFNAVGTKTQIFTRGSQLLGPKFDTMVVESLQREMHRQGVVYHSDQGPTEVLRDPSSGALTVVTETGEKFGPFDQVGDAFYWW